MSYLKEFLTQIHNRDTNKFLELWEEYCTSDSVDADEFMQLLKAIQGTEMAKPFGQLVETAIPLWQIIQDEKQSYEVLRLLIDLQTTNSPSLAKLTLETLQKIHGQDPKFNERLKLIGLRNFDQFQGALSKYDLVAHMAKGNAVFHTGGWGAGEIIEVSFVREHLLIEFENVNGRKDLSFTNAFKTLMPLPSSHFLARRFINPDALEKDGKENPIELVKLLLRDLGPKTAGEIKDMLCELVIPEKEWTKWWQATRAKMKKDPMIESPESLKDSFILRKAEVSPEERLRHEIAGKTVPNDIIQITYNFVRDTPSLTKNKEIKEMLQDKLVGLLNDSSLSRSQTLQLYILLEQFFNYKSKDLRLADYIQQLSNIEDAVHEIEIIAFKKRALVAIKESRPDWVDLFMKFLLTIPQSQIRDYLLKELNQGTTRQLLEKQLQQLLDQPSSYPDMFVWYFQKLMNEDEEGIPYETTEGKCRFFESFLILLNDLDSISSYKDLHKKMYNMLLAKRYELVRRLLQYANLEVAKEFLLLASKCRSLSDHDVKILRSLTEVVHPSLGQPKHKGAHYQDSNIIWTTEEGYLRTQDRIRQIGTVEMIENAREIETARAYGDLRENSEFKFAQERRARLQSELKTLSEQLNRARIITKDDIHFEEVSVGSIVEIADEKGNRLRYSILGPWDANPDDNILSFSSKFAQAMLGKKAGENFSFKDEEFQIIGISNYLNK